MKILGIFSHCDDEIICGWPLFQKDDIEKHLIITCSDRNRHGERRVDALKEVCEKFNINLVGVMDLDNNFYALPTRYNDFVLTDAVKAVEGVIAKAITDIEPTYLFTHNPVGEYGHGTHRLLFEIITQHPMAGCLLTYFTDICEFNKCHRGRNIIPDSVRSAYYDHNNKNQIYLNPDFYITAKRIYEKHHAWTWKKEEPPEYPKGICNLYCV